MKKIAEGARSGKAASSPVVPAVNSESDAIPARTTLPTLPRLCPVQAKAKTRVAASSPKTARGQRQQGDLARQQDDDQDRPEAGPAGYPDHVGRGERVAERPLQDRAGDPQRRPDQERLDRARQPQRLDDLLVGRAAAIAEEDLDDFAERDFTAPKASEARVAASSAATRAAKTRVRRAT